MKKIIQLDLQVLDRNQMRKIKGGSLAPTRCCADCVQIKQCVCCNVGENENCSAETDVGVTCGNVFIPCKTQSSECTC